MAVVSLFTVKTLRSILTGIRPPGSRLGFLSGQTESKGRGAKAEGGGDRDED